MKRFLKVLPLVFLAILILVPTFSCYSADKTLRFGITLGWLDNQSGKKLEQGFKDALKEFGGEGTFVVANYDPKKQSEQIEDFIKMKVDAICIAAADPAAIAPAVRRAVDAGIPVFSGDSLIPGAAVTTTILSNNFGMGVYTGQYIAERLKGKGNIGVIDLPSNETWDLRFLGLKWVLRNYPNIKIASKWSYNPSGNVTPRQAVDNMLTANAKKGSLNAIWCAWDGAALEGALAIKNAGRQAEIFTTGIDGGTQSFEYISTGTPFQLCMAQSMYQMSYQQIYYAHEFLGGAKVPRLAISPVYAVTKDVLKGAPKDVGEIYDKPGVAELKLGWKRAL